MSAADSRKAIPMPIETTVYDVFPELRQAHAMDQKDFPDIREPIFWDVFRCCKPYTCLSVERFYNIFQSIQYIARSDIPGDIVECGVFLGGSIVGAALFAEHFGLSDRCFVAIDTFAGFPNNVVDTDVNGVQHDLSGLESMSREFRHIVERNIDAHGFVDRFRIIEGPVEQTLRGEHGVVNSAYLRLDTDYYASTLLELEVLYPTLSGGGVLIIDDYGHFEGARLAVDEYLAELGHPPALFRVDYTGRAGIKHRHPAG